MEEPVKRRTRGETRKGKTIAESKVEDVESWAKYFKRGYQNIVRGEDGSFLVLDATLTKTDFPAALADPAKVIPHLMGDDYISVLARRYAPTQLRAAAEERRLAVTGDIDAQVAVGRTTLAEAERELLAATARWRSAPDAPSRTVAAQEVAAANAAVATADERLRTAAAPHRYIVKMRDLKRSILVPGSGDDRPVEHVIYRLVPQTTEAPERVVTTST